MASTRRDRFLSDRSAVIGRPCLLGGALDPALRGVRRTAPARGEKYLTAKVEMRHLFSPMTPFIIVMFATVVLLAYFPLALACDPEGHRRLHNGAPHLIPCIWHGPASR
jgi:hypothetical protein